MLAQHQAVAAPELVGVEPLVVAPVLEQPVDMDTRLVGEHPGADHALLPGHLAPGGLLHQRRDRGNAAHVDTAVDAVEVLERQRAFLQRGITGAISPRPLTVVLICVAPPRTAARVLAVARPKSSGVHFQLQIQALGEKAKRACIANGSITPTVSAKRSRRAPAAWATSATRTMNSGSAREASSQPRHTSRPASRAAPTSRAASRNAQSRSRPLVLQHQVRDR